MSYRLQIQIFDWFSFQVRKQKHEHNKDQIASNHQESHSATDIYFEHTQLATSVYVKETEKCSSLIVHLFFFAH